jgi:hypothetical protein
MPNEFAKVRNHLEYDSFGKLLDADDRQTVAKATATVREIKVRAKSIRRSEVTQVANPIPRRA